MHTLRKIYCRTFQTVFKIALPFLPYRTPEIVPSVKKLPEIIRANGSSRVLIITDAGIRSLGLTKRLENALTAADIPSVSGKDFPMDAETWDVTSFIPQCQHFCCFTTQIMCISVPVS